MKVILLSTESKVKPGEIYHNVYGDLEISQFTNRIFTGQHLYFVSSEKIGSGDWYIDDTNSLRKSVTDDEDYWSVRQDYLKVIATTDKVLTKCVYCNGNYMYDHNMGCERRRGSYHRVKLIPNYFVKEYVDSNGKIEEVQLESKEETQVHKSFLKITKDFEVVIKKQPQWKSSDESMIMYNVPEDELDNENMITGRDFLIKEVLNSSKKGLEEVNKNHEEMIEEYQENGFGDMHPGNIESYKTGLHYTHGYTIGHLELLKEINMLLSMSKKEIIALIKKNEIIAAENKKYMDELLKEIKDKK